MLRLVTDNIPVLISYVDSDLKYRFNNREYEEWFGKTREDIYGKHIKDYMGEEGFKMIKEHLDRALSGENVSYERFFKFEDRKARFTRTDIVPHFNSNGTVKGLFVLVDDITERKNTEEKIKASLREKETLLKEIHHRVKNNFQVITSLLSLQEKGINDSRSIEILKEPQSRIRAMALIHERLYQSHDLAQIEFDEYIEIISQELCSF